MRDKFAPDYLNFIKDPAPFLIPWVGWGLANVISMVTTMIVVHTEFFLDILYVPALGFCLLGLPLLAGYLDSRWRAWAALTGSGSAVLVVFYIKLAHTEPGGDYAEAYGMYLVAWTLVVYPFIMAASFGIGKASRAIVGRLHRRHC